MGESFLRRHKILRAFLFGLAVLMLAILLLLGYRMKGPHRSYALDFVKTGQGEPGILEVGVAQRDITPNLSLYDTYNDLNNNDEYEPGTGFAGWFHKGPDTYNDLNKNGKFDAVWMAGFSSNRPAKGVHDPLSARAIAFRNNGLTLAMVTLDAIGLFHDKVIDIRKSIEPALNVDHVIVSSLHNHESPDTMGIWSGPIPTPGNFDYANMDRIKKACKEAVEEAVKNLQPADMICAEINIDPEGFVEDTRLPIVIDTKINVARFIKHGSDGNLPTDTIATFVNWSNHPETLGSRNPLLTADFPGYWRDGVEHGVGEPNGELGVGGMCLYFQGSVGGLMTQLHITVPHRNGVDKYKEASFEKAQALGENLALVTLKALRSDGVRTCPNPRVAVGAKTIYAPLQGVYRWAIMLGLVHPGFFWPNMARTEVNAVRIGDIEMVTVPGELYPEIADGGIEAPPGQDFPIAPVEVPPLRKEMKGRLNMVIGLANDEIGYIIPKSQWDTEPPRAYKEKGQYGEENSGGPDVAPTIHRETLALLYRMHEALGVK